MNDKAPFSGPEPSGGAQPGASEHRDSEQAWQRLLYLGYYRTGLAGLFVILDLLDQTPPPFGEHNLTLFTTVALLYAAFGVATLFTIKWRRPDYHVQVYFHVLFDIAAITILMHASGGVRSGLGMLLVVAVAGASLLMEGRTSRLFAAIATLAVLAEQVFVRLEAAPFAAGYTHAGLLGASFFATAILAHVLAQRLRESEALAERRGVDLANMAQLTEYIIQRMQTGIVVVDASDTIRLINESAYQLLEIADGAEGQAIGKDCPELRRQLRLWWSDPDMEPQIFRATDTASEVLPRFARLGTDETAGTLIFLEDTAAMAQQAQQLKLASLGRLTASIAHEVRNPLGAISHAGQLLAESPDIKPHDQRLTQIIKEHSERVNTIIENIMQLSRRDRAQPEELALRPWLEGFVGEYCDHYQIDPAGIRIEVQPEDTRVRADPTQLHQIVWNLCDNGMKHNRPTGGPWLQLRAGLPDDSQNPYLDIIDSGPGIAPELVQHIFEPFFTTASDGTGMGLYISRELCESNQARLAYIPAREGGCRFRITFADPRRRQVA